MGLRDLVASGDLVIPTKLVKLSDSSGFAVRGLSPNDALGLYYRHTGELSGLFEKFIGVVRDGGSGDMSVAAEVGASLVGGAPRVMAEIIAVATDSDPKGDDWEADVAIATRFSTGVQAAALEAIGDLTFTSDMPAKKFFGLVLAMAQSTQAAIPKLSG